jgi:glycosyltransferase involved in cell wall biosynthesis
MVLGRSWSWPIVVHSHLRWSFVWQRPQQIHSRLAETRPVLFMEEPEFPADCRESWLRLSNPLPNLTVATPVLPREIEGRAAEERQVRLLLQGVLAGPLGRRFAGAVHWLFTPLMIDQVDAFPEPAAVVYDCMDELSQFEFAPPELRERERRLLRRADLVFTGGHRLFLAKRRLHPHVHFFGCGVDFEHFHRAASPLDPPAEVAALPEPRMGYVGVIDERLDYSLLATLAASHPGASLVMVGPVVKVDPETLPKGPNIHYVGPKDYRILPEILAGFAVCLMPFALNRATEYINPTKTLEYLATGKPVVSTPVPDVVRNFSRWVFVEGAERFSDRVAKVLAGERRDSRGGLEAARAASWDRVTGDMEALVDEALASSGGMARKRGRAIGASGRPELTATR